MNTEKDLAKLMEELKKRDIQSSEELQAFMNGLTGQSFDDIPARTDKKGRSQDLVFDAYETTLPKGKKLVKEALELDPDNAEAFIYLASIEKDITKVIPQYEKAIKAAEKSLGKKFFKENKGVFWGMVETRPYMRAKAGLADCYFAQKEFDKAIDIYEEMLALNPRDNQGIRYLLSSLLLGKTDLTRYELFIKSQDTDGSAVWTYNNALYSFKKLGITSKSEKALLAAYTSNKFVVDYLLGIKKLPKALPQYIGIGDENEAVSYVVQAWTIWIDSDGALDWLYDFKKKQSKSK
ncbi:tetratricopeptide repeat protein [Arenibacter sp. 6A1]|uniref:tetratricopeptide repeat protein n=1 Tax=Arenibacter sp. 6A1 TaxID=2720391 RepID=UPI001445D20B|nr:tetratricopeptide repeat protein [Arenibacter sp. 6A1]NKI27558.1 tetratricopeptide repeat protein [Arenibacter sp. 6A1]